MAIGRPIELTPNIATKNISSIATADQTEFTVTGGYRINELAVYRNGVRLVDGRDFSATDGSTVTLISAAEVDDVIEFAVFDSFDIAGTIVSAASTQTLDGNLHVTGELFTGSFKPTNLVASAATFNSALHVGSALTANAAGDVETIGIITAATFKGDGSGLTGIGETVNVRTETITVSGVSTFTGVSNFSAAVNVDATTDSTSSTTGALIVDGGLGVAKNVYIGAGLSVAGTLTYEDVTNVDAVGMITAKGGVNVSGGEFKVGTGVTIASTSGVATFAEDVTFIGAGAKNAVWDKSSSSLDFVDDAKANFGTSNDLSIYHNASHSYIHDSGTGDLRITGSTIKLLDSAQSENMIVATENDSVDLYYNNSKKFETTNDGTVTTGISTATGIDIADKITHTGDSNTAIRFPGADLITFETAGSERLRIHENGKISVGVDNDSYELTLQGVSGGAPTLWLRDGGTTNNPRILFGDTGAASVGVVLYSNSDDTMRFSTGGEEFIRLTDNSSLTGKCGIGTTNPQQRLHVEAAAGGDSYVQVDTNGNGGILLDVQGTQRGVFATDSAFSGNLINLAIGAKNDLRIRTGGSYTQRLIIGEAGISTFSATPHDDKGSLRDIPLRSVTGSAATLVAADAGKVVSTNTTGWTVPGSTFDEGDTVTLLNNSAGNLTITCSAVTTYLTSDGSTVTSSTLGARGLATLYFVSASVAYLQGTALS